MAEQSPEAERLRQWQENLLDLSAGERAARVEALAGSDADLKPALRDWLVVVDILAAIERLFSDARCTTAAGEEPAPRVDARIGSRIRQYRVERLLGSGGMGTVYLAAREVRGVQQAVALKLMRSALGSRHGHDRFEQETRILATLRHPHIAALYDLGETEDGQPFLVMEYVDGVPITDYCRTHLHTVHERLHLLQQVAAALAHAHRHLVVHRDIKPSNILVDAQGQAKLLDFGIAKLLDEAPGPGITGTAIGPLTPEYAAPEQLRPGAISVATDVYQFGALCFRVLCGRAPYRADPADTYGWLRAVAEDEPTTLPRALDGAERAWAPQVNLARVRRQLSRDLDAVVRKALAKAPAARYGSMDAMAGDLEALLDGRPVAARRAGAWYFLRRWIERWPYVSAGAAFALSALLATALVALHQARLAQAEAQRALVAAHRADASLEFITGLFHNAGPGGYTPEQLQSRNLLELATERLNAQAPGEPQVVGRLQFEIGQIYVERGEFAKALPLLEQAMAKWRQVPDADPAVLARALERSAQAAVRAGRIRDALRWLDEVDRVPHGVLAEGDAVRVEALLTRAMLDRDLYRTEHSLVLLDRALVLADRLGGEEGLALQAHIQETRGRSLIDLERLDEGHAALDVARAGYVRLYGPADYRVLLTDEWLSYLLIADQHLDAANAEFERIGRQIATTYGNRSWMYATNLYDRGRIQEENGDLAAARARYEKAAAAFADSSTPGATRRMVALQHLAYVDLKQGRAAAAEGHFTEVLDTWKDQMPADAPVLAYALHGQARSLLAQDKTAAARAAIDAAIGVLNAAEPQPRDELCHLLQSRSRIAREERQLAEAGVFFDQALACQRNVLEQRRAKLAPDHPRIVDNLFQIGALQWEGGDRPAAQAAWKEALDLASAEAAAVLRAKIADVEKAFPSG